MAIKILLLIFALSITTFGTTYVQCRYCGQKIFRVKDKYEMEFNVDKMMKMKYFMLMSGLICKDMIIRFYRSLEIYSKYY